MKRIILTLGYLFFTLLLLFCGRAAWAAAATYDFGGALTVVDGTNTILTNGGSERTPVSGTFTIDTNNNGSMVINVFSFQGSDWQTNTGTFSGGGGNQLYLDYSADWLGSTMEMALVWDATGFFGGTGAVPASDATATVDIGPAPIATTTKDWDPQVGTGTVTDDGIAGGVIGGGSAIDGYSFNLDIGTMFLTSCDTGACAGFPVMPDFANPGAGLFQFNGVSSGFWFDPPGSVGYEYTMTDGALFTDILNFPVGFNSPFQVEAEGTALGQFGPAESVDFEALLGHGVSQFRITGIDPETDPADPAAFPIQLAFNTATASFSMQALSGVPIPASVWLFGSGLLALLGVSRRRRAQKTA